MRIIRLKEVVHLTSLSKTSIYERMKAGTFPTNFSLGGRAVGWDEKTVQSWILSKLEPQNEQSSKSTGA
ncbi:AlpA family phage regulatory protein [Shewanella xiamenensis]|uniref:AlpA family phage regulatory protein n=1 Tax=Shewanella xiamenensis TaxID=332186 RepID=UPI00313AA836